MATQESKAAMKKQLEELEEKDKENGPVLIPLGRRCGTCHECMSEPRLKVNKNGKKDVHQCENPCFGDRDFAMCPTQWVEKHPKERQITKQEQLVERQIKVSSQQLRCANAAVSVQVTRTASGGGMKFSASDVPVSPGDALLT